VRLLDTHGVFEWSKDFIEGTTTSEVRPKVSDRTYLYLASTCLAPQQPRVPAEQYRPSLAILRIGAYGASGGAAISMLLPGCIAPKWGAASPSKVLPAGMHNAKLR
jgi:hypothetical protein